MRVRRGLGRDVLELIGLVAQDDRARALGDPGVGAQRLAADLFDEPLRAARPGVGRVDRLTPPAGERARHVAAADEAEHRRQRLALVEEALLDEPRALL